MGGKVLGEAARAELLRACEAVRAHPERLGLRRADFWDCVAADMGLTAGAVHERARRWGLLGLAAMRPRAEVRCSAPGCDRVVQERRLYDAATAGYCLRCRTRAYRRGAQ